MKEAAKNKVTVARQIQKSLSQTGTSALTKKPRLMVLPSMTIPTKPGKTNQQSVEENIEETPPTSPTHIIEEQPTSSLQSPPVSTPTVSPNLLALLKSLPSSAI